MRVYWIVNPMPNSRLNMLLNLPANSASRTCSASRSTGPVHRCDPSASAKNELEKPGMFMIRMPISAKPRRMSSVGSRSETGNDPGAAEGSSCGLHSCAAGAAEV